MTASTSTMVASLPDSGWVSVRRSPSRYVNGRFPFTQRTNLDESSIHRVGVDINDFRDFSVDARTAADTNVIAGIKQRFGDITRQSQFHLTKSGRAVGMLTTNNTNTARCAIALRSIPSTRPCQRRNSWLHSNALTNH